MTSDALSPMLGNYRYYDDALAACGQIGLSGLKVPYAQKDDYLAEAYKVIVHGFAKQRHDQLLNAVAKKLHDTTFAIWTAGLNHNKARCEVILARYVQFVDKKRGSLRSINAAPTGQHYDSRIKAAWAKWQSLRKVAPALSSYVTTDWNDSFDDCAKVNASLSIIYSEMWKWILDGEKEQRELSKARIDKWRLGLALAGGGGGIGVGVLLATHWDTIRSFLGV